MTWAEISQKYPGQWIGLTDVVRKETSADIISAVPAYIDKSRTELLKMQLHNDNLVTLHTAPEVLDDMATTAGI